MTMMFYKYNDIGQLSSFSPDKPMDAFVGDQTLATGHQNVVYPVCVNLSNLSVLLSQKI